MSCILAEKQYPGFTSSRHIEKLGYKGVETTELVFEDNRQPVANLLGGVEGQGFKQMMAAIEVGRVNVAARGVGVAQRAFELSIEYAQQRHAFGVPIAQHQAIQFKLADMATKIQAARLLTNYAARKKDAGERADIECGMAKLFATETCFEVVSEAMRVHGGYGFSKEYEVERLYRDAPLLIIGEGTNEIQRVIIAKGLLERYRISGVITSQAGHAREPHAHHRDRVRLIVDEQEAPAELRRRPRRWCRSRRTSRRRARPDATTRRRSGAGCRAVSAWDTRCARETTSARSCATRRRWAACRAPLAPASAVAAPCTARARPRTRRSDSARGSRTYTRMTSCLAGQRRFVRAP